MSLVVVSLLLLLLLLLLLCPSVAQYMSENCTGVECPRSGAMCVHGHCRKLERLPCDTATVCPGEAPVCWKSFCSATKSTFVACDQLGFVSVVSDTPLAVGRHKAAWPALIYDDVPAVVKRPLDMTTKSRQMFVRSALEEVRAYSTMGDRIDEFAPLYFGGCLRADQMMPVTIHEHLPICYPQVLAMNAPWCTRVLLAARIFEIVNFMMTPRVGGHAAVMCDLKPEQICFNHGLMAKLVDLNQLERVILPEDDDDDESSESEKPAQDGATPTATKKKKRERTAKPTQAAKDESRVFAGAKCTPGQDERDLDNGRLLQCFDKCFTSFHREHPRLVMQEERCDAATRRCPGYSVAANMFVYCHTFVRPLLDLSDVPAAVRRDVQAVFDRCSSVNASARETTYKFLKRFEPIFDSKAYQACSVHQHNVLLQQVLQATINASGAHHRDFRPFYLVNANQQAHVDPHANTALRNFVLLVSCVGVLALYLALSNRKLSKASDQR
jgi:hypothetical protein